MPRPWWTLALVFVGPVVGGVVRGIENGHTLEGIGEAASFATTSLKNPFTAAAIATPTYSGLPCSFTFTQEGHNHPVKYNICPLLHRHKPSAKAPGNNESKGPIEVEEGPIKIEIIEETPPTRTTSVYTIGLRGALERDTTLPAELQCPEDTWICLIVENTRPSHPSEPKRRLQVVPIARGPDVPQNAWIGDWKSPETNSTETVLNYVLSGGTYVDQRQGAYFFFVCDSVPEPSEPTFYYRWKGTHSFVWKSRHACPVTLPTRTTDIPTPTTTTTDPDGDMEKEPPIDQPPEIPVIPGERSRFNWPIAMSIVFIVLMAARFSRASKRVTNVAGQLEGRSGASKVVSRPTQVLSWLSPFRRQNVDEYRASERMEEMIPLSPIEDERKPTVSNRGQVGRYGSM